MSCNALNGLAREIARGVGTLRLEERLTKTAPVGKATGLESGSLNDPLRDLLQKSLETSSRVSSRISSRTRAKKREAWPMSAKNARESGLRSCRETVPAKPSAVAAESLAENAQWRSMAYAQARRSRYVMMFFGGDQLSLDGRLAHSL